MLVNESKSLVSAGVKNGDRVLDVGTGTGSLAATWKRACPRARSSALIRRKGFIAYVQKNARSPRVRFEVGDAQALKLKDASFDNTFALLVMNFVPDANKGDKIMQIENDYDRLWWLGWQ